MDVKINREKRKTLCIRIDDNGEIIVFAPNKLNIKEIEKFVLQKTSWINKHKKMVLEEKERIKDLYDLNYVQILGKQVSIISSVNARKCFFSADALIVPARDEQVKVYQQIKKFLIEKSKKYLEERLIFFAKLMKLNYSSFKISNAKARWGSCTKKGQISLNWRLFMLDEKQIDYVIVHELCHLLQFNHSLVFYKLVEAVIPDWKTVRLELKKNAYILKLFR